MDSGVLLSEVMRSRRDDAERRSEAAAAGVAERRSGERGPLAQR